MSIIQRMGLVATDDQDRPKNPLKILRATPLKGPPEHQISTDIVSMQWFVRYSAIHFKFTWVLLINNHWFTKHQVVIAQYDSNPKVHFVNASVWYVHMKYYDITRYNGLLLEWLSKIFVYFEILSFDKSWQVNIIPGFVGFSPVQWRSRVIKDTSAKL